MGEDFDILEEDLNEEEVEKLPGWLAKLREAYQRRKMRLRMT